MIAKDLEIKQEINNINKQIAELVKKHNIALELEEIDMTLNNFHRGYLLVAIIPERRIN